jgi:hypothetical protein
VSANLNVFIQRYGLTALIAAAAMSIGVVIAWETGWGKFWAPGAPKIEPATRKAEDIALLPAYTLPPMAQAYKETNERPLFSQTRRPIPPAPVAVAVQTMQKGKYRLAGTIVDPTVSAAFLVEIQSGKTFRVAKGSVVNPSDAQGPKLDSVSATQAILKLGDDTEMLTLSTAKSPPPSQASLADPRQAQLPGSLQPTQAGAPQPLPQPIAQPGFAAGPQAPSNSFGPAGAFGRGQPSAPPPGIGGQPIPLPTGIGGTPIPLPPGSGVVLPNPQGATDVAAPTANTTPPPAESTSLRRRRFQNLPQ